MGQKQTTSWVITFWRRLYSAYQHSPPALPRFRQTFEALEERVVPSSATALLAGGDVQLLFGVNQQKEIIESIASTHHLAANSGRADIEVLQVLEHNPAEEPRGFETHATQMSETMPEVERNPADEHRLFEPPGVQVSEILQVPERNPSEEHRIFEPPAVQQSSSFGPPLESSELPSSYDLRVGDHVTSVKDQGSCGSCWAFATYAALESAILMEEGPVRDFSENHLKNSHGFDVGPCTGGNPTISQAYLTRYHGPVDEVDDPYHPWDDRPSPGGPPQYYVRESAILDTDNEIKNAIMTSGGLYTSMKWDDAYYRPADFTYYYNGSDCSDHAVTIVGWDDTKVTAAPEFGAWLIKNSWGTAFGDNGYFWMSYSDTVGGNVGFSFYDPVAPSEFSRVYYHDEFGYVGGLNTPYAFNAFTPVANEELTAVQFWTQADWAQYDIRIYDTFSGGTLSDLLTSTTGSSAYAGHHTVDLPTGVSLTAGDSFYVYLHIWNGGTYPQAIDIQDPGYNSASTANPGESYYSFDGTIWDDIYSWNPTTNFSIKALTTSDPNQPPIITSLSDSPDPVSSIANLTLTADCVSDPDGTVTSVGFYRESNSLAGLQIGVGGDTLLATDTSGIGGWSVTFNVSGLGEGTYTYYAQATDNDGAKSVAVSTSNTVREMGIPTLTAPAPVTLDSTPTFTWDAVCEATHYEIWVNDLTTGTSAVLWEDSLTGTSWTPTSPLDLNHSYRVWLRASNASGAGLWSDPLDFAVNSNLTSTILGPSGTVIDLRPEVSWTEVEGAATYELWVSDMTTGTSGVVQKTGLEGTTYTPLADLTSTHTYRCWIRPFNDMGQPGNWSAHQDMTVYALESPTLTNPAPVTLDSTPTFTWDAVCEATHYEIWVNDLTTGTSAVLWEDSLTGTSWTPTSPLVLNHSYRAWLRASNASGVGLWSAPLDFAVNSNLTSTLLGPSGTVIDLRPEVSWTEVEGADTYELWVSDLTTGTSGVVQKTGLVGTTYTPLADLTSTHTYRCWIRPFNDMGQPGNWSAHQDMTVYALESPTLTAPAPVTLDSTPTFTWDAVSEATHYEIWVNDLTTGTSAVLWEDSLTGTSWTPTSPLVLNHSYRVWLRASNASGAGLWSDPLDFAVNSYLTPTVLTPTGTVTNLRPLFSWTEVEGAETYELWVSNMTTGTSGVVQKTGLVETTFTPLADLTSGHIYRWWIRAFNDMGQGGVWSSFGDFTVSIL